MDLTLVEIGSAQIFYNQYHKLAVIRMQKITQFVCIIMKNVIKRKILVINTH